MLNSTPITNDQLLKEIGTSRIDIERRKKLESMIPTLSTAEREELMKLLNEANASVPAMTEKELKQIQELNAKYEKELSKLVKDAQKAGLAAFEGMEKEEAHGNLNQLETELASVKTTTTKAVAKPLSKSLIKVILILILLTVLSWAGLHYLS